MSSSMSMPMSISSSMSLSIFMFMFNFMSLLQTGNKTSRKRQLTYVCCKQKTETANVCLFAANGDRSFAFLGCQTINSNRRLLCQQTFPSLPLCRSHLTLSIRNRDARVPMRFYATFSYTWPQTVF
jgi:hypothetical protein